MTNSKNNSRVKRHRSTTEQFNKDLEEGKSFEIKCADILRELGYTEVEVSDCGKKQYWDIEAISPEGNKVFVECKWDKRAKSTGNIALETKYRGQPSGIMREEHNLWMHSDGKQSVFIMDSSSLRVFTEDKHKEGKCRYLPWLGDGSSGYVLSIEVLKAEFGDGLHEYIIE